MSETLFRRVDYSLQQLVDAIDIGSIGLPDIQRPFVWEASKVRDLFDSMFRGFPVGYLLFWENPPEDAGETQIGIGEHGHKRPSRLIIDGQQRLTSLYAVMKGKAIIDQDFREKRIQIAFHPLTTRFEVTSAAIRKSNEWIDDISNKVFANGAGTFTLVNQYISGLRAHREVTPEEQDLAAKNIERLLSLKNYPFHALEVHAEADEEDVAEVFVRVNSQGKRLNQADFILTLLSVFWDEGRKALEDFARRSRIAPTDGRPSPYNHHIEPDADQLLRVAVAVGLRRARLKYAYQFLRGKDVETGTFTAEAREKQLARLRDAQAKVLNVTSWHEFLKVLISAGYRSRQFLSSANTVLYCYAFYLIGRHDFAVPPADLRRIIARLYIMATLTGHYTNSPESQMDEDLANIRGADTADDFVEALDKIISSRLTTDFWEIQLPAAMEVSSGNAAVLRAYHAAQNYLDARVLYSTMRISELVDPALVNIRKPLERHHLFPRAWLQSQGIKEVRQTNQIANFALVEWGDNASISDRAPSDYAPEYEASFSAAELASFYEHHALPERWFDLDYWVFLEQRRKLMAGVIRKAYERLTADGATADE
jgi:hypothetical protein